jgi:hypothetical protein
MKQSQIMQLEEELHNQRVKNLESIIGEER